MRTRHILDYAFYAKSIAVVGASDQPFSFGYHFLRHLLDDRFKGAIYPVNPQKAVVQGLKAYPSLSEIPGEIDYVICCVPTSKVLSLLDECSHKKVRLVHLFTARLSETGRPEASALEKLILDRARELGIKLIGPNCMGVYSPQTGISFGYGLPAEKGNIGVVSQTGGGATVLIEYCALLGLRFSKVVSYGNALDIDESDIIDYLASDEDTGLIAGYFEGVKDGAKFIRSLKNASTRKPVIVIKGGKGKSGSRAVSSHTAAIAGSRDLWQIAFKQAGAIEVDSLEEMANLLTLFSYLPRVSGNRAAIMGGGGGKCVISADLAEDNGLVLPALSQGLRVKLKGLVPDLWDWLGNPVDFSIWGDSAGKTVEIPNLFVESPDYDFLIIQISVDNPLDDEWWVNIVKMSADSIIGLSGKKLKPVVAVLSGAKPGYRDLENVRWRTLMEVRTSLINAGVPTFDTMAEAARAMNLYISYWRRKAI